MNKPIVYFDLDNTLADFDASPKIPNDEKHIHHHPSIYKPGFFSELPLMSGALRFINDLIDANEWDIHILTQPLSLSSTSYSEKADWVARYFPDLINKITMTQDKTLLKGHLLVDDNPKWKAFEGNFYLFNYKDSYESFRELREYMSNLKQELNSVPLYDTVKGVKSGKKISKV